jgi:hypothetical protein
MEPVDLSPNVAPYGGNLQRLAFRRMLFSGAYYVDDNIKPELQVLGLFQEYEEDNSEAG